MNLNRVLNYRQNFNELTIQGLDFSNGFKCNDMHKFERLNNLSINLYELNFYQDSYKWKYKLIHIGTSENNTVNRVIDLLICRNHCALIKKLNVFNGE